MNLNQVTLPSTDVARGVAFYRALGFRQIVANLPEYARFECPVGGATFSLHRVDHVTPGGAVVYFECDDLDATVARLEKEGVVFTAGPCDQPWLWREAYLLDPDGNTLCLFHAGTIRRHPPWRLRDDAGGAAASAPYTIVVDDQPSDDDVQVLREGLTAHALPVTGAPGFKSVAVFARDGNGAVVGGIFALLNWNWLHVALVWVAEPLRGTGLGHRLLEAIEEVAVQRGCTASHLDTFSYQARPFYEQHGYEVFGTLDGYPGEQRRFFMRKSLRRA
jgi:catechol 2,3-dioxygenase-like lactoylglutathione lyase family enzyme/GNAT superfamily N-acetyltransferase